MPIADDTSDGPTRIDSLAALATETRNPLAANLDRLDAESIARLMNGPDASYWLPDRSHCGATAAGWAADIHRCGYQRQARRARCR